MGCVRNALVPPCRSPPDVAPGVVDYVSSPPSSAYDRALELAQDISKNGRFSECACVHVVHVDLCSTVGPPGGKAGPLACSGSLSGIW